MAGAFFDKPDWFASPDNQVATIDKEFDSSIAQTPEYQSADNAGKANMKLAYKQLVEEGASGSLHNPATIQGIRDQSAADNAGAIENAITAAARSTAGSAYRAVNMADDLVGPISSTFAKHLSLYAEKQRNLPMTKASKELGLDMAKWRKEYDASDNILDKAIASAKLFGNVITNPEAILQTGAESTGSLAASATGAYLGAKTGGAVGSVAGPAGAATGAAVGAPVGMFLGSAQDAATAKMSERILEALTKNGIEPTESNIQMFLDKNPGLVEQSQQDAVKYGTILGVIDTALGGLFSKFATLPTRAARKEAMRSMDDASRAMLAEKAQKLGVSVKDVTDDFINAGAKDILDAQSFKSKLGYKSVSYGGEVIGEPISEAAATLAVNDELTAEDLIMETIGGVGAGPVGASINTAAMGSKLAGNKTGEFVKKIIASTPESKAIEVQQKKEIKDAKDQNDSSIRWQTLQDIKNTDPRDAKVDAWADPENEDYDPIKAVKVLAKAEDLDTELIDKARGVQNNFKAHLLEIGGQIQELQDERKALADAGKDTTNIDSQLARASKILDIKRATFKEVAAQVTLIKNRDQAIAQTKEITSIDPETATPAEVSKHITDSLGSSGNKFTATDEHIDKLLTRTDIPVEQVTVLKNMKDANAARRVVVENAKVKNTNEVANDIYHGIENSDFKGIDAYQRGVASHTAAGRTAEAQKQLDGLTKFRDDHQQKYDSMLDIFETMQTAKDKNNPEAALSPEQLATYRGMQKKAKAEGKEFYIHPIKSQKLMTSIAQEVAALKIEVKLAESVIAGSKVSTKATTSPKESSASTSDPAKLATENTLKTWDNLQPEETITLYRGEGSNSNKEGDWWTTDKVKAKKYSDDGNVLVVKISSDAISKHAAQGHGGKDEFVFPNGIKQALGRTDSTKSSPQKRVKTSFIALSAMDRAKVAYIDNQTGILTPLALKDYEKQHGDSTGWVVLSFDSLKAFNDSMSHGAANEAVTLAGHAIKNVADKMGLQTFRKGGDFFVATPKGKESILAKKIQEEANKIVGTLEVKADAEGNGISYKGVDYAPGHYNAINIRAGHGESTKAAADAFGNEKKRLENPDELRAGETLKPDREEFPASFKAGPTEQRISPLVTASTIPKSLLSFLATKNDEAAFVHVYIDELTGHYNHAAYAELYAERVAQYGEENVDVTSDDVPGLRDVNDTYGEANGDLFLQGAGAIYDAVKAASGADIDIIHMSGDEFARIGSQEEIAKFEKELVKRLKTAKIKLKNVTVPLNYIWRERGKNYDSADKVLAKRKNYLKFLEEVVTPGTKESRLTRIAGASAALRARDEDGDFVRRRGDFLGHHDLNSIQALIQADLKARGLTQEQFDAWGRSKSKTPPVKNSSNQSQETEINISTLEEIADSFDSNLEELTIDQIDEVIAKFDESLTELNTEVQEAEEILKCFKSSKG